MELQNPGENLPRILGSAPTDLRDIAHTYWPVSTSYPPEYAQFLQGMLIPEVQVKARVREMACDISEYMAGKRPVFISLGAGSMDFCTDITRALGIVPFAREDILVKSYEGDKSTRTAKLFVPDEVKRLAKGRDVYLVEDIIDTGWSGEGLLEDAVKWGACSLAYVALCDKPDRREVRGVDKIPRFTGFIVPGDAFLLGYGMDYKSYFRNLPDVCVANREKIKEFNL